MKRTFQSCTKFLVPKIPESIVYGFCYKPPSNNIEGETFVNYL